jgi:hypothetical protein
MQFIGVVPIMSDSVATAPKSAATERVDADGSALAHVERWMETIREINAEQQAHPKLHVYTDPSGYDLEKWVSVFREDHGQPNS